MRKSDAIQAFEEYKNSPSRVYDLLYALGVEKELLNSPAHREKLEEWLFRIIDNLSEVMKKNYGLDDFVILEDGIIIKISNSMLEEKIKMSFTPEGYILSMFCNHGRCEDVYGNKGFIITKIKRSFLEGDSEIMEESLDGSGFVTAMKVERNGIEVQFSRDNLDILCNNDSSRYHWNCSPFINVNEMQSSIEGLKNISYLISKFPNTEHYFEDLFGKDKFSELEKLLSMLEK